MCEALGDGAVTLPWRWFIDQQMKTTREGTHTEAAHTSSKGGGTKHTLLHTSPASTQSSNSCAPSGLSGSSLDRIRFRSSRPEKWE